MADEKVELREMNFRQLVPWTELFRGFQVALDPKKLLLAGAGLLAMALGWWLLAVIFYSARTEPKFGSGQYKNWDQFKDDRAKWDLLHEAAGTEPRFADANDLAHSPEEYDSIRREVDAVLDRLKAGDRRFTIVLKDEQGNETVRKDLEVKSCIRNSFFQVCFVITGK